MQIAICDDDRVWLEEAERIIREYGQKNGLEIELHTFSESDTLFATQEYVPDVLFMDIQLGEKEDGISVTGLVNEKWRNCQVVYLTDYISYATHVYRTEHVFFMLKNEFESRIDEIFSKIFYVLDRRSKKLIFTLSKGGMITLNPDEILYFERNRRITEVHTDYGTHVVRDSLDEIAKHLPEVDFVRCHNSYIVAFDAVLEYRKDCFSMKSGATVPISRSYRIRVQDAFLKWAGEQMRL
ncbi:MAG: LytTR family DNA-binding domain-containing protein [Lachnospiraceae bacterium]|nr:LytTR family DNA-binding domain-containing protein [Lachnospiraceae bacterium]